MKKIGIISDTHGTFDGTLREFLKDVDEIWHAGDIGSLELADAIAAFKPLRAVSGNIDGGLTRRVYPHSPTSMSRMSAPPESTGSTKSAPPCGWSSTAPTCATWRSANGRGDSRNGNKICGVMTPHILLLLDKSAA